MARPLKTKPELKPGNRSIDIDIDQIEKLAALQCTMEEAAWFFNCSKTFISERYGEAFARGREIGKISLRRIQFNLAKTSAGMAIFLGKNYLGQVDNHEVTIPDADDHFKAIAAAISKADAGTN